MVGVDLRPVAVALAVGVVVGFAQAAPMLQLPQFFTAIQGSPSLVTTVAAISTPPFVIALLVAGPVSGYLLQRIGPRTLIAGGAIAVGLANIIVSIVLDQSTAYPFFIVPFMLIGAGFVIATTVRTAIIFASVPRDLPASAAALNEASIGMGSRVGVIVAVVVTTQTALDTYRASLAGQAADAIEAQVSALQELLALVGMQPTTQLVASIDPGEAAGVPGRRGRGHAARRARAGHRGHRHGHHRVLRDESGARSGAERLGPRDSVAPPRMARRQGWRLRAPDR